MVQGQLGLSSLLLESTSLPYSYTIIPSTIIASEEHGSAKWGDAEAVNKKYRALPPSENKLLTQHVRIGLDGKKHRRNLNI